MRGKSCFAVDHMITNGRIIRMVCGKQHEKLNDFDI